MRRIGACAAMIALAIASPATAQVYDLRLYNIDDVMTAEITNSEFTDLLIATAYYPGNSYYTDITAFVRPGINTLSLELQNTGGGWTYGYDFRLDGVSIASGSCGQVGVVGCDNNSYTLGTRFQSSIQFNAVAAVPEPATWAMMLFGFGVVGFSMRRRRSQLKALPQGT